eukprot:750210-Hanusia_phi.AAC.2
MHKFISLVHKLISPTHAGIREVGGQEEGSYQWGTIEEVCKGGVQAALAIVLAGFLFCCILIGSADLRGSAVSATSRLTATADAIMQVVLEGRSSGGEYEDERALAAAINMAVDTNQTDILTFPSEFNQTLGEVGKYVDETRVAVAEEKSMQKTYKQYNEGTDPW